MDEKKIARAEHKYARISPRKVEIICNMIRGKDAKYAMALMENTPKAGCLRDLRRRRPHPQERHAQSSGPYVPHQQAHQPHYDRCG